MAASRTSGETEGLPEGKTMDQIVERLDRLVAIMRLAHADALASASASVRKDKVKAAVLDACENGWVSAGKLQKLVMTKTDAANTPSALISPNSSTAACSLNEAADPPLNIVQLGCSSIVRWRSFEAFGRAPDHAPARARHQRTRNQRALARDCDAARSTGRRGRAQ